MRTRERGVALAVATVLFASTPARAADPPTSPSPSQADAPSRTQPPPDQARIDAEKRNAEGLDRYQRGDYDGARLAFQQAWAVLASVDLLYNLARAEVKSGHALEALVHLRQILRNPKATSEDKEKAQRLLDEANRLTAHIVIDAPAGATVYIDKVESGEAPVAEAFDVTAGKHVCEARANGTARLIEVDASVGAVVTARFALDAARPPTVSAPVPMPEPAPESGVQDKRAAREQAPDDHSHYRTRESSARVIVPIVIGGAAVIATALAVGFGVASKSKEDDAVTFRDTHSAGFCATRSSADCTQYASILSSQQSATNVERVLLVTGGVLAVGAVVTYLVWPHESGMERGAWVAPQVMPGGGGVTLGGAF